MMSFSCRKMKFQILQVLLDEDSDILVKLVD
jgi:hypothetical protein